MHFVFGDHVLDPAWRELTAARSRSRSIPGVRPAAASDVEPEIRQTNPAHGPVLRRVALPAAIAPERRRRSLSAGRFFDTLFPVISLSFPLGTGMIAARRDPRDDLRFRRLLARS